MRRKKKLIGVMCLFLTFSLCWGCTSKSAQEEPTSTSLPYYEFQGVRAGANWTDAKLVFGEPENQIQEDSSLTTYTYPHIMVITAKLNGQESVKAIRLRSNAVATAQGSMIGDLKETIIKNEGTVYTTDREGGMVYVKETTTLCFMLDEDGMVIAIEYGMIG